MAYAHPMYGTGKLDIILHEYSLFRFISYVEFLVVLKNLSAVRF
jgi:hypothetical protein